MDSELSALKRAVDVAGGQSALARKLGNGCKQQNVWSWLNESKKAPPAFVLAIEKVTGVPAHELRPDLYPESKGRAA